MKNELIYYINENKRTVVCIAEDCQYDLVHELEHKFDSCTDLEKDIIKDIIDWHSLNFLLDYKYVGKAHCSKSDDFDVEKGKIIARHKMRSKYNQAKINIMKQYCNSINNVLEILCNNWEFYLNNRDKHNEVINEYKEGQR